MIKLTNLIKELSKPENIYASEINPEESSDDFLQKGYKLGQQTIDPETGTITTDVINAPKLKQVKSELVKLAQSFEIFVYSKNEDISGLATDIRKNLYDIKRKVSALNGMIELQNQQRK